MARIRTVKPELFRHEGLFELETETGLPIRLAFAGLFTCCDREGRFKWIPKTLKLDVLPHDSIDFSHVLDALMTRGFVVKYSSAGVVYGCIPTFPKHQVINNRERASEIPSFEADSSEVIETTGQSTREPRVNHADLDLHKGKGREGNKEGKGNGREQEPRVNAVSPPSVAMDVEDIFSYWRMVMVKSDQAKLTPARDTAVRKMLKLGYTVTDIKKGIDGCRRSPHHMGVNKQRTVYDDLELICRSGEKLEAFISNTGAASGVETIEMTQDRIEQQAERVAAYLQEYQS